MQKAPMKIIILSAASIICFLWNCGCATVFHTKNSDFPDENIDNVSFLTAIARKAWCIEGHYHGIHISKARVGGIYSSPITPNPEGPGKICKQHIKYSVEKKMPGSDFSYTNTHGVTFTLYAMEDGIVYRCKYVDEKLY